MLRGKVMRRNNGSLYFLIHLTLQPGRDDDLITRLLAASRGQRAAIVREMMRGGVSNGRFSPNRDDSESMPVHLAGMEIEV
jgi:hypothetical protein